MTPPNTHDRGQVGIGTLIVFIAMVLVAAIASGVLVTAVGDLQTKSAEASEESGEQVSNRVQVMNAVGTQIDTSNETVGAVNLTVGLSPSADDIDLTDALVTWTGPSGSHSLTHNSSTDGDGNFTVAQVKDDDDSAPVLNARDDRFAMNFDVDSFAGGDLPAGSTVQLHITTRSGATTTVELNVPRSVSGQNSVRL